MTYFIPKGKHRSGFHFAPILKLKKQYKGTFLFSNECYFYPKNANDFAINKLFGISIGGLHHKNSIRIGWRPTVNENEIEVIAYYYNKGKRYWQTICFCKTLTTYKFEINLQFISNAAFIKISKYTESSIKFNFDFPIFKFGYYLFPYVGGQQPAKKDMHFQLEF